MIDIRETILAQYANSPALTGVIARFNAAADPRRLIETFLQHVWDPTTATGWGLDVWGRIVGVNRVQKIAPSQFLGFEEAVDGSGSSRPFNDGIFYNGSTLSNSYALTDALFRQLIFAKAAANISGGSIADINRILMILFGGSGRIYVDDSEAEQHIMTLCHSWDFSPLDATLIQQSGVLPRTSGVTVHYRRVQ